MKIAISSTIELDTYKSVEKIAKEEKRSFSQSLDLLIQEALEARLKKKR